MANELERERENEFIHSLQCSQRYGDQNGKHATAAEMFLLSPLSHTAMITFSFIYFLL